MSKPSHLDPSELGTKEYWDTYYQNDLENNEEDDTEQVEDPSELESWFDDVDAPAKVLEYLTSEDFPLSPQSNLPPCSVLDLGTGNGSMLFSLRLIGGYKGRLVGVDYSQQSVDLARRLWQRYEEQDSPGSAIEFEKLDLIQENATLQPWWPESGFDLVLDKGTFDAISLSAATSDHGLGRQVRIFELYPGKVVDLMASEGYLLVTSCNWTEEELIEWFLKGEGVQNRLKVFERIQYPRYEFGGQQGQGVASVCFQKIGATPEYG